MAIDHANPIMAQAIEILRQNDTGRLMKASPAMYPHQWSWDAALIAMGLGHVSLDRAVDEMRALLRGQWKNGMIPQIQYDPDVSAEVYFPDADRWDSPRLNPDAPRDVRTSGLIQPPVHAIAVRHLCTLAGNEQGREIAAEFYRPLLEWHRYLLSARDPENSGLMTIVHPWESGMDNSPRWDRAMARIEVPTDGLPPYTRRDLRHVADASERPTDADYDRYMWIVEVMKRGECRVDQMYDVLPFRVKDVFSSAILVAANEALLQLGSMAGAALEDLDILEAWINRGRRGLAAAWDDETGCCTDIDVYDDQPVRVYTIASFAPVVAGQMTVAVRADMIRLWQSTRFMGDQDLRWPLPPSTSPVAMEFNPVRYWRGPVWPVMNWIMWRAWNRVGEFEIADVLRRGAIEQVETGGFFEYFEPYTGHGLGSDRQSWTAAAVLDMLAND